MRHYHHHLVPPDVTDALQRIQHLTCIIPTVGLSVGDGTTLNLAGFVIGIVAEVSKVGGEVPGRQRLFCFSLGFSFLVNGSLIVPFFPTSCSIRCGGSHAEDPAQTLESRGPTFVAQLCISSWQLTCFLSSQNLSVTICKLR